MKELRLRRLRNPESGRVVICPLDHGVTMGAIRGLGDLGRTVQSIGDHVDAFVVHKGQIPLLARQLRDRPAVSVLVHLNASVQGSPSHPAKVMVAAVEEAVALGADGVSVQLNLGCEGDDQMLATLGRVAREASAVGFPLLAMVYPQPPGLRPDSVRDTVHSARVAAELGADLIKVSVPPEPGAIEQIVAAVDVPVVVSGGPHQGDRVAVLAAVRAAIDGGASGVALGRNVFQDNDPALTAARLYRLVHEPLTVPGGAPMSRPIAVPHGVG